MLTPQEVSSHAFPKAVMGGYNMSAVDEFLDELTDDYTALYKENTALKAKMKVLVEKVEDYRSTEDSMRATLLTAQKMADSIVREAESKREQMLSGVEEEVRVRKLQMESETAAAQERLSAGQRELAEFIAASRAVCAKELEFLERLPELPAEASAAAAAQAAETPAASEIEQNLFAKFGADTPEETAPEASAEPQASPQAAAPESAPVPEKPDYPAGNPFEEKPDDEPTRRINLNDLKFGRNYSGASDEDEN